MHTENRRTHRIRGEDGSANVCRCHRHTETRERPVSRCFDPQNEAINRERQEVRRRRERQTEADNYERNPGRSRAAEKPPPPSHCSLSQDDRLSCSCVCVPGHLSKRGRDEIWVRIVVNDVALLTPSSSSFDRGPGSCGASPSSTSCLLASLPLPLPTPTVSARITGCLILCDFRRGGDFTIQ